MNEGNKGNKGNKGYYIYSAIVVIAILTLFGLITYLIYDILIKLATNTFTNITAIQSIITILLTVYLGGYFSKAVEYKNNKRLESYKVQKEIAIRVIDLAGLFINHSQEEEIRKALINENFKIKLFFNDNLVKLMNEFIQSPNIELYNQIVDELKKCLK